MTSEISVDRDTRPTVDDIEKAAEVVYAAMSPTLQYNWPLLGARLGCDLWLKHENHTPIGSFKVRGGLVYVDHLLKVAPDTPGIVAATRGNHGQSLAFAARRAGIAATLVIPHGNSREKNAAMEALGAELVVHGRDFDEAADRAFGLADERQLHRVPTFDALLSLGIASYAVELFRAVDGIDTVYVPIGQGSGICAVIAARDALGLETEVVGVVSDRLPAYKLSVQAERVVETEAGDTIADGVACRVPVEDAVRIILRGASRVISVPEEAIEDAMRAIYTDTHNVAEGAGALALAGVFLERHRAKNQRVAAIVTGGNVDIDVLVRVLGEGGPAGRESGRRTVGRRI